MCVCYVEYELVVADILILFPQFNIDAPYWQHVPTCVHINMIIRGVVVNSMSVLLRPLMGKVGRRSVQTNVE